VSVYWSLALIEYLVLTHLTSPGVGYRVPAADCWNHLRPSLLSNCADIQSRPSLRATSLRSAKRQAVILPVRPLYSQTVTKMTTNIIKLFLSPDSCSRIITALAMKMHATAALCTFLFHQWLVRTKINIYNSKLESTGYSALPSPTRLMQRHFELNTSPWCSIHGPDIRAVQQCAQYHRLANSDLSSWCSGFSFLHF